MTWQEFKTWVDNQLTERQLSQDVSIWYIDISFPEEEEELYLGFDKSCGISIG